MRILFALAFFAAGAVLGTGPAAAQVAKSYPFCSNTSGIGKECVYDNIAQCQQDVEGIGGWCQRGPGFNPQEPEGYGEFPQQPNE